MIPLLVDACQAMDEIFWLEAYGDQAALLEGVTDPALRRFVEINYGPWDRLADNRPFLPGVGEKPAGAGFYPADLTKEEFEKAAAASPDSLALRGLYTVVRRDPQKGLVAVPYHEAFAAQVERAVARLHEAAALAEDAGLRNYLELRAKALLADDYRASDMAWMDMKTNGVDCVIGPIETYEDKLFGYKAAHEGFVLIKDKEWSQRLARYAKLLPELQKRLPVPAEYKRESPGTDSDLNAYDAVYYAGDANAGAKTIAINLPNDEQVQLAKGSRRLQLKNAMRAKFDRILTPIADKMIAADQRSHIQFDAFFANVMFHETAHGLGIKQTLGRQGHGARGAQGRGGGDGGGQGRRAGPVPGDPAARHEGAGRGRPHGQLRHLPGRAVPLGALRRRRRPRPGEHGAVRLLQGRRARSRATRRAGPTAWTPPKMRAAIDAYSAKVLTHPGRRRLRRRGRVPAQGRSDGPAAQGRPRDAGHGRHPHRRRLQAGDGGARGGRHARALTPRHVARPTGLPGLPGGPSARRGQARLRLRPIIC